MITVAFAWWQVLLFLLGIVIYQIFKHVMGMQKQAQDAISSTTLFMDEQPD